MTFVSCNSEEQRDEESPFPVILRNAGSEESASVFMRFFAYAQNDTKGCHPEC